MLIRKRKTWQLGDHRMKQDWSYFDPILTPLKQFKNLLSQVSSRGHESGSQNSVWPARGSKIKSGILGNGFELEILTHPVTIHIYVGLRNLIVMVKVGSGWSNPHGKWKKWPAVQKRTAVFSVSWVRDFQTVDYKSVRLFTIRSIFFRICFPWFDIMVFQPQIYCNTMSLLKHLQELLTKPLIICFQVCSKLLSHSDLPND